MGAAFQRAALMQRCPSTVRAQKEGNMSFNEKQFPLEHFEEWLPGMLGYIQHAKDERILYEAGETVAHVAFMLHPELRA
jgi:hypothetical protein